MFKHGKWLVFAQHECYQLIGPCHGGDHIVAAMNMNVCPKCGQSCDLSFRDRWARVIRRRVNDATWYRPSTWRAWHWEYKSRGFLEEGGYDFRKFRQNSATADASQSVPTRA